MAKITVEEAKDLTIIPADTVIKVTVDGTKIIDVKGDRGDWQKIEFKFNIAEAPGEYAELKNTPIWGSVAFRLTESPDNKLKQWTEALLGIELSAGFELDTDMYMGRQARAVIGNYDKKNGGKGHQVSALLPLRATPGMSTPAAAPVTATVSAGAAPASAVAAASSGGWSDDPPF